MSNKELSAEIALKLVYDQVQWQRAAGETDLRFILYFISRLMGDIREGKTEEEILSEYANEEEDDE